MSVISDCRYEDEIQSTIIAWRDGVEIHVPNQPDHPVCADIIAAGLTIAPWAPPPVDLVAYLKAKRYAVEIGGITFGGAFIATDRESQAMVMGAYALASRDAERTFNWQTDSGFVTLTAAQIIATAVAVGDHVQSCFDVQAPLAAGIALETITTTAQIDAADWPGSSE